VAVICVPIAAAEATVRTPAPDDERQPATRGAPFAAGELEAKSGDADAGRARKERVRLRREDSRKEDEADRGKALARQPSEPSPQETEAKG
jgi:hypothetical protein